MLVILLLTTCLLCALAYRFYGNFLVKRCRLDDSIETPAVSQPDGVDYVPTRASILFGHHFSSIAGAGPIVGPIFAAIYFGWLPAWMWIVVGAIFIGGVHDFGSALMSVKFKGRSIAETSRNLVGRTTGLLFVIFVLLALIYVIVVFLDLTASTFAGKPEVATASGWFILTALAFGFIITRPRVSFVKAILIFVPVTFAGLAIGQAFPAPSAVEGGFLFSKYFWTAIILGYCFIAAILPVNVLLQPRDFLSSTFLYAMLALGIVGLVVAAPANNIGAFTGWYSEDANPGYLFPALFITIACGACSGFHSIVSSGTTSKQLRVETDIKRVNYGAMLVEGVLATLALATVAVLTQSQIAAVDANPVKIFATGSATFFAAIGVPKEVGFVFASLAVSTFLLTTLDTCTRLCRFLFEELISVRNAATRYGGTALVLVPPAILAFQTFNGEPAWKAIWVLFGATNQLMAALALITFVVFLRARRIQYGFALIPAILMVGTPLVALAMMTFNADMHIILRGIAVSMLALGTFVVFTSVRSILGGQPLAGDTDHLAGQP